jgi:hypothetical protein
MLPKPIMAPASMKPYAISKKTEPRIGSGCSDAL